MNIKQGSNQILLFELCLCNTQYVISKILGSDSDYEQYCLIGCDAV